MPKISTNLDYIIDKSNKKPDKKHFFSTKRDFLQKS